jgi:BirA family biotin operon repressor/biotin-[acetyl-CoA-carboxylase] ligase
MVTLYFRDLIVTFTDKHKQTLALLADGAFHSGTELANNLGVSRSSVWKHLNSFEKLGLSYSAISGKGYRLDYPIEFLSAHSIKAGLSENIKSLISSLHIADVINSTNSYLVEEAQQQAASGTVCLAEYQLAGKGRRGRQWVSPYGHNIYLSILWRFQQGPAAISGLSLAMGVAVVRALKQANVGQVGLKWPNDIYFEGKKLGGILVEVSGETEGPCSAVVGLGLNCYLPETETTNIHQPWTDLHSINAGQRISRNYLVALLLNQLLPVLAEFERNTLDTYIDEWRSYDCLKNKTAVLHSGTLQITGQVLGVDNNGMLLMQLADGKTQVFASGEVSFSPVST